MRTTLTLDDDIANALQTLVRDSGMSFKAVVNDVLRRGLRSEPAAGPGYRIEAVHLGRPHYPDLDDIGEILLAAEGEGLE